MIATYIIYRELISAIYKEYFKINSKGAQKSVDKEQRT